MAKSPRHAKGDAPLCTRPRGVQTGSAGAHLASHAVRVQHGHSLLPGVCDLQAPDCCDTQTKADQGSDSLCTLVWWCTFEGCVFTRRTSCPSRRTAARSNVIYMQGAPLRPHAWACTSPAHLTSSSCNDIFCSCCFCRLVISMASRRVGLSNEDQGTDRREVHRIVQRGR
jgi:hypothetical protein